MDAIFSKTLLKFIVECILDWDLLAKLFLISPLLSSSSNPFELKNLRTRDSGFFASYLNLPYYTDTPSSRISIWSLGSIYSIFFIAAITMTPCYCFSLNMFSTIEQHSKDRLLKGLSRMYTSALEQKILASDIFCS